ncbi:MAG TPA: phenylalanine--tRNA ligase subunit alpha [Candidatus Saccharimonadia bacterium]|nr:phenylalanine--tRNA ligase subunit alpha [Candidatus Saccharimonadia bacterium]
MAINEQTILGEIEAAVDLTALEVLRVAVLGRKGRLTEQLKAIGALPAGERAAAGAEANRLRQAIEAAVEARQVALQRLAATAATSTPLDLTAPGIAPQLGHRHPVSLVHDELIDLFWQMGYQVAEGPEVETEWHNFTALNIPPDHPARDMQDTFYLEEAHLPRTHTSGIQIRHMQEHKERLPIRIIAPGKVYRNEDEDARHSWSFYQIEGLVVDEGISVADLKGTLEAMMRGVLGEGTEIRLRSNYFPYTEPSVEMDATCPACHGSGRIADKGCALCSGTGWLETGGAGMVHPQVLRNVGIDPEVYSGFAFGFGIDRMAALKYGVNDVREFWRPNFKFLEQF